jgi:hypothetical protein
MKPDAITVLPLLLALGLGGTAIRSQTNWQQFTSVTPTPGGRTIFGLAYDSHHQRTILFGGRLFGGFYTNETWQYDGANWLQLTPSSSPPGISSNLMVYDTARQRMVLFGGANSFGFSSQTWEFDGSSWQQRSPATTPPARSGGAACYDTVRRRMVMFGGWDGTRMEDTWEYDGTNWVQNLTGSHPSGRSDNVMAYDEGRERIVMHGGYNDVLQFLGDTWEYAGTNWQQISTPHTPGPVADPGITYDRGLGRIVLFGGKQSWVTPNTNQTFVYDGVDWTDITPTLSGGPSARWVAQMVYDEARGRSVAFGGIDNFNQFPGDTWELVTPGVAVHHSFGHGCPGTHGKPQLLLADNMLPRLGNAWGLRLQNLPTAAGTLAVFSLGFSNTTSPLGSLPVALASFGMPGCTLDVSPEINVYPLANNGVAGVTVTIPNQTWLLGIHLYAQGGVYDPTANAAGLVLSDSAAATIGH